MNSIFKKKMVTEINIIIMTIYNSSSITKIYLNFIPVCEPSIIRIQDLIYEIVPPMQDGGQMKESSIPITIA